MTRKFHTKKHLIGHDQLKPQEKMAELKEKTVDSTEKMEQAASITPAAIPSTSPPPSVPVMAQRTFQFTREKNRFEKLKDTFHQLINRFK